jgi:exopolyphosphatase / guanosine-5'-triphosphate,3'-diphosphate pyrophosphatase
MRFAAIDIGSNSIRLLVAEVAEGQGWGGAIETVARAGEVCRLGRGLHETGLIAEDLVDRAADICRDFARRARSLGAAHVVAGATAALRSAGNGLEVAERLGASAGIPVRILGGDDEARLVYRAVVLGLGARARESQCVVFDLGGGSTEVVSGVGLQPGRWNSLGFGAVSLTERMLPGDPPTAQTLAAAREHIAAELMHGCASMPDRATMLAGVGGTVTVLASVDRGLVDYDPAALEGWWIERSRALEMIERIVGMSHVERRRLPIMGEGRADIIGAGALVVEALIRRFEAPGLVCSTQGLRYGLVRLAAEEWQARPDADRR